MSSARALGGASGSPAALDAEVSKVAAYSEGDQYDGQMHEGQVARLRLQIVGVPGVGACPPREKHKKAHGEQYVSRASRKLHTASSLSERDIRNVSLTSNIKMQKIYFLG